MLSKQNVERGLTLFLYFVITILLPLMVAQQQCVQLSEDDTVETPKEFKNEEV